jgi:hypothetical protein
MKVIKDESESRNAKMSQLNSGNSGGPRSCSRNGDKPKGIRGFSNRETPPVNKVSKKMARCPSSGSPTPESRSFVN